jgi:hypothetical protein
MLGVVCMYHSFNSTIRPAPTGSRTRSMGSLRLYCRGWVYPSLPAKNSPSLPPSRRIQYRKSRSQQEDNFILLLTSFPHHHSYIPSPKVLRLEHASHPVLHSPSDVCSSHKQQTRITGREGVPWYVLALPAIFPSASSLLTPSLHLASPPLISTIL